MTDPRPDRPPYGSELPAVTDGGPADDHTDAGVAELSRVEDNVHWVMTRGDGTVETGSSHNLITQVGMQVMAERAFSIAGAGAAPVGIKLGLGSTAPAATGGGAALGSYVVGSNLVFDSGFPTSGMNGLYRRITYKSTYPPGVATSATPLTEAVLFNNTNADATSIASQTIARAIIAPGAKAAADQLAVTWFIDQLPS